MLDLPFANNKKWSGKQEEGLILDDTQKKLKELKIYFILLFILNALK